MDDFEGYGDWDWDSGGIDLSSLGGGIDLSNIDLGGAIDQSILGGDDWYKYLNIDEMPNFGFDLSAMPEDVASGAFSDEAIREALATQQFENLFGPTGAPEDVISGSAADEAIKEALATKQFEDLYGPTGAPEDVMSGDAYKEKIAEDFWKTLEPPIPEDIYDEKLKEQFWTGLTPRDPYEIDQQTSRDETTALKTMVDPFEIDQQTSRDETTALQGPSVPVRDPYEVDGQQGSRTEETATTGTTTTTTPGGKDVVKTDTKTDTKKDAATSLIDQLLGGDKKNQALMMALIGGILGLLSKGSAPKGPVGYQGGIPKYTATRIPGRGVQYTRAAGGGLMDLAQGGQPARYLRGGTDGMADQIKTSIDGKQPARLSHGEFVVPADVVSHLGNGNSDAGADVLYEMMAKVRKARTGTPKQGKQINPRKYTPA